MEERYSVSELAHLFGISTQTLRYYDKIGLFKPAYVDKHNGYRHYSYKQFFTLSMILQLKRLNFSLEQIQQYSTTKDIEALAENLKSEKELIRQEIAQLRSLEDKTDRLLKKLQLSRRVTASQSCELQQEPDRFQYEIPINFEIKDLYQYIKIMYESYIHSSFSSGLLSHSEIVLKIYRENLLKKQFRVYNSIGFFMDRQLEQSEPPVRGVTKIPGGQFASCLHAGPYETIHRSYQRLYSFIEKEGLTICGDSIEFSIISLSLADHPEDFLTQIQIPVA